MADISQTGRMLKMLKRAGGRGVANYTFPQYGILRYSARVQELRVEGHNILVTRETLPNGRASNVFRYTLIEEDEKR